MAATFAPSLFMRLIIVTCSACTLTRRPFFDPPHACPRPSPPLDRRESFPLAPRFRRPPRWRACSRQAGPPESPGRAHRGLIPSLPCGPLASQKGWSSRWRSCRGDRAANTTMVCTPRRRRRPPGAPAWPVHRLARRLVPVPKRPAHRRHTPPPSASRAVFPTRVS